MAERQASAYERFQWYRHRQNPDDPGLTVSYVYALSGDVDTDRLDDALRDVVSTAFPRLLDYFTEVGGKLLARSRPVPRRVLRPCERQDELLDPGGIDPTGQELFRFRFWRESGERLLLRLDFSHVVFDGGCYAPFCAALAACWQGDTPALERPFGAARRSDPAQDAAYWQTVLAGRRLHQPLPFAPASHRESRRITAKETISGDAAAGIHRFLRDHELSPLQFVVGVTGALLHAYGDGDGDDDTGVVVAHTVDTRPYGAPYGCHTNLLPLWVDVQAGHSALSLLEGVRTQREALRDHQDFPTFDLLALAAGTGRTADRGGSALNVVVNSSSAMLPTEVPHLRGVDVSWVRTPDTGSSSELSVNFSSDAQGLHLSFDSSTRVLSPQALSALAANFSRMARSVVAAPHRPPARCDLSRPPEPVAEGPVGTAPDHRGLGAALAEAAARHAERVAVVDDHRSLTYGELLDAAQRLGGALSADGTPRQRPIGVLLERSAAIPVAYLTALTLRRTFVPLDPRLPDDRLAYMARTADLGVVLVDAATRDRAARLFPHIPAQEVDGDPPTAPPGPQTHGARPTAPADAGRTAYVMFTSGSTGHPKGVAVSEGNLVNFLHTVREDPGMRPDDRIVALTPIGFDISLLEILLPLLCGASVQVLSDEARTSGTLLAQHIDSGAATVVQATPSTWRILKAAGWRAARPMTLLCGGEALDRELAQYLLGQDAAVYNMYGPTEATIWASWQRVTDADRIHLGEPAYNTRYYVVDADGRSVAPGMRGELMIAGDCVAQGYLNAPETAFGTLPDGTPSYRTGDLVRHEGPHLTYVSRKDGQRKVNGHRIELDEVAAAVAAQAPAATVVAVVRPEPEPHLRCFVRLPDAERFDAVEVRERCRETLPYYMVPQAVHRLREIPLTANGKTDVKKLSEAPLSSLDLYPQDEATGEAPGEAPGEAAGARGAARDDGGTDGHDLLTELRRLVAGELGLPEPDADRPLGYQGVNSVGYNVLAARIRERYGVVVHAHEFYRLNTLRNVAETVARLSQARPGARPEARPEAAPRPAPAPRPTAADGRLAVIGLSAVLPGGPDPETFWRTLLDGRDCVGPAGTGRGLPGEIAGFLPGVKGFDARFFSVSPREASWMDPRQRLLLQSVWHTLEDAGYAASELSGTRTGCYMAATGNDYALLQARTDTRQIPYSLVGHSMSLIANRISSWFDWHGPSTVLDTACSGSLVALVKACRDLRAGVCDTAVVGGVNLILDPQINEGLRSARFLSPDHRCATFDASANGYVRGEGYGSFLVKRLEDALADGDDIRAVIESVAENHGGRANSLTAPNPHAQFGLLLDAYTPELAARTGYIETHGTGTELGDAIEVDALKRAWEHLVPRPTGRRVRLGAVKSHIGHLEPAAGVASVTKVIKAFEHRMLPANLHFHRLSSGIDLHGRPFEVLRKNIPWDDEGAGLVAGISSFGFGGTNAHVVLSAPPDPPAPPAVPVRTRLVPLSARTPQALRRMTARLLDHVGRTGPLSDGDLLDLSYTLCRREPLPYRLAWCVSSAGELVHALRTAGEPVHVPSADPGEHVPHPTAEQAREHYLAGRPVDRRGLFAGQAPRRTPLPAYPFDETDFWFTDEERTA